ncbi:putative late blight resistance protein homolog R1A-3 isoform X1 [Henckelia pumila]|uniref:putative late blight resistance protein homolog R1A-3 isoform X1 n=1 Tax=Henckelia pumila TaxID=405737 RepID=UPI003C6E7A5E
MATAYASLLSLGHTLGQLSQHPPRQMAVLGKAQIDSLLDNIIFLLDFLEEFSLTRGGEIQALEEKIARSAYAAEDIIESRVVDQILPNSEAESESSFILLCQNLQKVMEEFDYVKKDVMKIKQTEGIKIMEQPAEDIIDSRMVDQILPNSKAERRRRGIFSFLDFLNLFKKETEGIKIMQRPRKAATAGSSKRDVMKIKETQGIQILHKPRKDATAGSFIRGASNNKNTMVGFDEDLNQIMETLTGDELNLQILPVVGMGGIGKTTLARNVFESPSIVHHFDRLAWVTISQQYSVHEILSGLLKEIGVLAGRDEEITQKNDDELGLSLHRSLFDRRYFIVMDDTWTIKVWDSIKRFLPDNGNGSRVLVTTRLSNVGDDFRSCTPHRLHLLDQDQSWALFCDKVFGKESCPPEFEKVGKIIMRNCGALPLAIVAISGLLAKSSRTVEYWEYVANHTHAALNMGGDELCFEILSLSYKHLPVHLKPCFLYLAIFPEDHKIRISRLVELWVAEGILKPIRSRSLEEIAEDNLKDLIDRNLIQVQNYGSRNKIKTCTIHDLIRDLCLKEARKEKFLRLTKLHSLDFHSAVSRSKPRRRHIIQRSSDREEFLKVAFDTSSLACSELKSTSAKLHRLLRVLKMNGICFYGEILRVVNYRHIKFFASRFPNMLNTLESLSLLWNLQTVIMDGFIGHSPTPINLPAEIWEMPQLRHIKRVGGDFSLPDPHSSNGGGDIIVLKNMQTLHKIRNFRCTDEVVHRIPNLKKLGITYREFPSGFGWDHYEVYNLARLRNLESLLLGSREKNVLQNLCLPQSLKKLTLESSGVCWEDLTVVGSLPHLEVLNLLYDSVKGRKWNPVEGQFLELKSLRIDFVSLEKWTADSSHFPSLEKLQLVFLICLQEIPEGIGEIQTLRSISLEDCSDSANSSAMKIQEEQKDLGNFDLVVRVTSHSS